MNFANGVPKGMKLGIRCNSHPDFKYDKSRIERYLSDSAGT